MRFILCVLIDYMCMNLCEIVFYCVVCCVLWCCIYVVSVVVVVIKDGLFFVSGVSWLLCELVESV